MEDVYVLRTVCRDFTGTITGSLTAFLPQVILGYGRLTAVTRSYIVRRHDFDACLVKDILDILMQIRINLAKAVGIPDIGIHLINRIIILKGSLQYKRTGSSITPGVFNAASINS